MKNFPASRLELSLCCSRWEKFKCRCHCRLYLCEHWIKGKLICYIRITRNYLVRGSVLRPHPVKFWIPLKVIISQSLSVYLFQPLTSFLVKIFYWTASWTYPGCDLVHCLLFCSEKGLQLILGTVLPRPTHSHDSPLDSLNAAHLSGEPKLVTVLQMWPQMCSGGEGSHSHLLPTILVMQPKICFFLFQWGFIKHNFFSPGPR